MNTSRAIKTLAALMFFSPLTLLAATEEQELRGKNLYAARCSACHSMDYNGVGPAHRNLLGRKAGTVSDYLYSVALKGSKLVWNEQTLDLWLTNPELLVPGQKMGINVPDAAERADVITYLKKATQP